MPSEVRARRRRNRISRMNRYAFAPLCLAAFVLVARAPGVRATTSTQLPAAIARMSPNAVFYKIRDVFRSHRPPPPYETYTLVRQNNDAEGYPDYATSYTFHIWVRTSDKAALGRKISQLGAIGQLEFMRPQFNSVDAPEDQPELADPGPPTADLFEPAPVHPHPISWVPTPEPSQTPSLQVIAHERYEFNLDYWVISVGMDDGLLHVVLAPRRDPERNRLRELWADPKTFELRKVMATDRLEACDGPHRCQIYPTMFTITIGHLDGIPVVTHIHGVVGGGYNGDDQIVEYSFNDITFPKELPDWYFDASDYAQHVTDAPT
jgi:hypothetical protein